MWYAFARLLEFIRETKFERLGVFAYSKEDGTRAGGMRGQIPDAVKKERCAAAMAEQKKISRARGKAKVGTKLNVLAERLATDADLKGADVRSWEHGHMRDQSKKAPAKAPNSMPPNTPSPVEKPMRRTSMAACT